MEWPRCCRSRPEASTTKVSGSSSHTAQKKFLVCYTCDRVIPPLSFRCLSISGETGMELAFSLSPCRRLLVDDRLKQII